MTYHEKSLISHGCRLTFLDLRGDHVKPMDKPSVPLVLCLGNFDGVHKAHQNLLRQSLALRDKKFPFGLCGVFTFFYPSSDYLRAQKAPEYSHGDMQSHVIRRKRGHHKHLSTLKEKLAYFAEAGMDFVCLCDFDQIRTLSPEDFLDLLYMDLGTRGVVCGFNFRFGVGGLGDASQLEAYFTRTVPQAFCEIMPPFCMDGDVVSSSRIRKMLLSGDVALASRHMGHPYTLSSMVIHGKQLGRSWGLPTANQTFLPESIIPAHGVYAVLCYTPHGVLPGVANVGSHPTVDDHAPVNCETHIIGYDHDLYGYKLKIAFLNRLRGEVKFPSADALREQIHKDIEDAVAYVKAYLDRQV